LAKKGPQRSWGGEQRELDSWKAGGVDLQEDEGGQVRGGRPRPDSGKKKSGKKKKKRGGDCPPGGTSNIRVKA